MTDYEFKINNIVGTGELTVECETDKLAEGFVETYDMSYFKSKEEAEEAKENGLEGSYVWELEGDQPGLYYEVDGDEGPQITIHESGSYTIRADTEEELYDTRNRLIDELTEVGLLKVTTNYEETKFEVNNVVGLASLDEYLKLEALSMAFPEHTSYEPEQFPALHFNKPRYSGTFLIYSEGKIISTGSSSVERAKEDVDELINELLDWLKMI